MAILRKNYIRSVNILFTKEQFSRLERVAEQKGINRSAAARLAIDAFCKMQLDNEPTCANGLRCFVPTYHSPPSRPQQSEIPTGGPPHAQNRG